MDKIKFKQHVTNIILETVKANFNVNRNLETRMISRNNAFYFKFHHPGEELQIIVETNGNIGIKIKTASYSDQLYAYYTFCKDDMHTALLPIIKKDLTLLVEDFYWGMKYAPLVEKDIDFELLRSKHPDWMTVYEKVRRTCRL